MGDINISGAGGFTKADAVRLDREVREFAERRAQQILEQSNQNAMDLYKNYWGVKVKEFIKLQ